MSERGLTAEGGGGRKGKYFGASVVSVMKRVSVKFTVNAGIN